MNSVLLHFVCIFIVFISNRDMKVAAFSGAGSALAHRSTNQSHSPTVLHSSPTSSSSSTHPAVQGWPEKYRGKLAEEGTGRPRRLHEGFFVEKATDTTLRALDVRNWPTWSTRDNPKWIVGKQNEDKVMPYNELSYVIRGKLEIVKPSGEKVIVKEGDLVTFPECFTSSWRVLEELTWHYYLY